MLETVELKQSQAIKRIILSAFPNYKKHKAFVSFFMSKVNISSYWDGGSRDEFAIVHIETGERKPLPTSTHPYFDIAAHGLANQATEDVESDHVGNVYLKRLPDGFALVSAGTFCGKPATAHVYLSSDKQLQADNAN